MANLHLRRRRDSNQLNSGVELSRVVGANRTDDATQYYCGRQSPTVESRRRRRCELDVS